MTATTANARTLPEATNRRAVLGAVLAAGAAASTAAIPAAGKPALGEDHGEDATEEEWAALEFEPIDADTRAKLKPPSNEVVTRSMVPVRLAWHIIGKTKDELKEIIRRLGLGDDDAGTEMVVGMSDAADLFGGATSRGVAGMNALTDRRAFLALVAPGAVLSSWAPASWAQADPVYAAMKAHQLAYDVFSEWWELTHAGRYIEDEASKRQWYDVQLAEEATFNAVLATKPTTKAGAIAAVRHVIDIGLATDELKDWLAMLLESPLVGAERHEEVRA